MTASRLRPAAILGLALLIVGAATSPVAADTASDVDDIRRQTAQVRGLQPLAEVPVEIIDLETHRRRLASAAREDGSVRALVVSQKLLVALGLLSADYDLVAALPEMYGDGVKGLYDDREGKMYVIAGPGSLSGDDKRTVAHELTHALQYQHFDLASLRAGNAIRDSDHYLAIKALIEGDATLTMQLWGREFLSPEEKAGLAGRDRSRAEALLAKMPLYFRQWLYFPYDEGALFAYSRYQSGGFDAVNAAFRELPQSTEQIIHPEKYVEREAPRSVTTPDLPVGLGGSWRTLITGVMGELELRILIEQFAPTEADDAAAGWGGDRYAMLEDDDGRLVIVLNTVWDSEPDAAQFYNAYAPTVATRFGPGQRRTVDEPSRIRWSTPAGPIQLLKTGDRVLVIYAPDAEALELTAAQFR